MRDDAWFRRQVGRHTNQWRDHPHDFARRTALKAGLALGALALLAVVLALLMLAALWGWLRGGEWSSLWLLLGVLVLAAGWPLLRALRLPRKCMPWSSGCGLPSTPRRSTNCASTCRCRCAWSPCPGSGCSGSPARC
jgi:hypothetical protein